MVTFVRNAPPFAFLPLLAAGVLLAGCAKVTERPTAPEPVVAPVARPAQSFPGTAAARTADQLDRTTAAERAAALRVAPSGGTALGVVRVSLGSPAEQGFWLKSPLVDAPRKGRVAVPGGQAVAVELRPGTGAAQLSLAAFRALGLNLTGLPEVTVTAD